MTPVVRAAAEGDILRQVERYAEQSLPNIALRFHAAVMTAIDGLAAMPDAGPPRPVANPTLDGLRRWPVKGFDEYWIYYLAQPDARTVIRVLHGKRDIDGVLATTRRTA